MSIYLTQASVLAGNWMKLICLSLVVLLISAGLVYSHVWVLAGDQMI